MLHGFADTIYQEALDAVGNKAERFATHCSAFWHIYSDHRTGERPPMPLCVVGAVRKTWPVANRHYAALIAHSDLIASCSV